MDARSSRRDRAADMAKTEERNANLAMIVRAEGGRPLRRNIVQNSRHHISRGSLGHTANHDTTRSDAGPDVTVPISRGKGS
jgi:hypothetical protein